MSITFTLPRADSTLSAYTPGSPSSFAAAHVVRMRAALVVAGGR